MIRGKNRAPEPQSLPNQAQMTSVRIGVLNRLFDGPDKSIV